MNELNGIILLDKRKGISSNQALQELKHLIGAKKAGHTGSLDPMATGMLPICLGEATKISQFLIDQSKIYEVEAQLGQSMDTGDAEGKISGISDIIEHTKDFWSQIIDQFHGEINQIPPMYSALKHKGQRLYKIARSGRTVERSPRKITIHSIDIRKISKDSIRFSVHCSKGTYIRVLVEDIAKSAGMLAYTSLLRRVRVGQFDQFRMIEFSELKSKFSEHNESLNEHLIPIEHALFNFRNIKLSHLQAKKFLNGQRLQLKLNGSGPIKVFDQGQNLLGIATQIDNSVIAPKRIFHL
jgi:tRNA pseudouridine55 synthase